MNEFYDLLAQERLILFLRRIAARFVDLLVLTIIGYLFIFIPVLQPIGNYGLLIGLIFIGVYEIVFHSHLGKGKSIGKRLLGLQVFRRDGTFLSIPKSAIRAIPFVFGLLITETIIQLTILFPLLESGFKWVGFTIMMLAGIASPILLFFTKPPQSLADLLVDSLTIPKSLNTVPLLQWMKVHPLSSNARVWQTRMGVFFIAFIPIALLISFLTSKEHSQHKKILSVTNQIVSKYQLPLTGVHFEADPNSQLTLLSFRLTENPAIVSHSGKSLGEATAFTLWTELSQTMPDIFSTNISAIELSYGLNIGIANGTESYRYSFYEGELDLKETR